MEISYLKNIFEFHPADTRERRDDHEKVRYLCLELAQHLNRLLPECHEKKRAIDHLDDCCKDSNAAIARHS